ncbi:MAG: CapA family protein [Spirochaetaceae bacterium]|jgi:poly-gamma-glutamate synthesis protein (capsule biosynthesis protein)|nr:CapA family protein [Spirochaetaceae bacterium]
MMKYFDPANPPTHSIPLEGSSLYMDDEEARWWLYKFAGHPIEEAEPGLLAGYNCSIEEHLSKPLDFTLPAGFKAEVEMTMAAAGDIYPAPQLNEQNTKHSFDDIQAFYFDNDLVYANLEAPVYPEAPSFTPVSASDYDAQIEAGVSKPPPPVMNLRAETIEIFHRNGRGSKASETLHCFSTANNHSLDMGEDGLVSTLKFLDSKKIIHSGTARSLEEQTKFPVININGIKTAILSYTFGLNLNLPLPGKEYLVNLVRLNKPGADLSLMEKHIKLAKASNADNAAKSANADLVVLCLHWGLEFESFPLAWQIYLAHKLIESGVDIIIGNHPHGIQGAETHHYIDKNGIGRTGLVLYAMGDLIGPIYVIESLQKEGRPLPNKLSNLDILCNSSLGALAKITVQKGRLNGRAETFISDADIKVLLRYFTYKDTLCTGFSLWDIKHFAQKLATGEIHPGKKATEEFNRLAALAQRVLHY